MILDSQLHRRPMPTNRHAGQFSTHYQTILHPSATPCSQGLATEFLARSVRAHHPPGSDHQVHRRLHQVGHSDPPRLGIAVHRKRTYSRKEQKQHVVHPDS
jgi:hypothetical protein